MSLQEYLGLNDDEMLRLMLGVDDDSISQQEVVEQAQKLATDVIVEASMPAFTTIIKL